MEFPEYLYHSTYKQRLESIMKEGLTGKYQNWDDSKPGTTYLAISPEIAQSYAESSDLVPDDFIDNIITFKIKTCLLDHSLLFIDSNVIDNVDTFEYRGKIFPQILKIIEV